ncbi:MAG: hypothetical protein GXN96_00915 [Aquificae bacterium]|nr:hypothetical protein [Aquificota bacterium]
MRFLLLFLLFLYTLFSLFLYDFIREKKIKLGGSVELSEKGLLLKDLSFYARDLLGRDWEIRFGKVLLGRELVLEKGTLILTSLREGKKKALRRSGV